MINLSEKLQKEWHPTLNEPLESQTFLSNKDKVWWLGECGHSWENSISNRKLGSGCLYCTGKRVLPGFNDLASQRPEVASEWHPTLNGELTPEQVTYKSSSINAWWLGKCGHEWQQKILHRSNGVNCGYCSNNRLLAGFNDLTTKNPQLAAEWHPTLNGDLTPEQVAPTSKLKVYWVCQKKDHAYKSSISDRHSKFSGCNICTNQQIHAKHNDLVTQNPNVAAEWHPTLNRNLTPEQVTSGSKKNVYWLCANKHTYQSTVGSRHRGKGCAICSGNTILAGFNDLLFKNPQLAAEWHPTLNGDKTSDMVTASSSYTAFWLGKCGHSWKAKIANRAHGAGCAVCAGKIVLAGFNDLAYKFPSIAAEWHPTKNGDLLPNQIHSTSNKKVWWQCVKGHEFFIAPNGRYKGASCLECSINSFVSKPEQEMVDFLLSHNVDLVQNDRKLLHGVELDVLVPGKDVAVEFNGVYWHSEGKGRRGNSRLRHFEKWDVCRKAGVRLIQVWEDDWSLKRDVVERNLLKVLGLAPTVNVDASTVVELSAQQAKGFMMREHVDAFAAAERHVGLVDAGIVKAAMSYTVAESVLTVNRFAAVGREVECFGKLLSSVASKHAVERAVSVSDNLWGGLVFEGNGFTVTGVVEPEFMFVVKRTDRYCQQVFTVDRFESDPGLKFVEGLTVAELADLNRLERVWDAGGMCWSKTL